MLLGSCDAWEGNSCTGSIVIFTKSLTHRRYSIYLEMKQKQLGFIKEAYNFQQFCYWQSGLSVQLKIYSPD